MKKVISFVVFVLVFITLLYFFYNYFRPEINQLSYRGSAYLNSILIKLNKGAGFVEIFITVIFGFLYGIFHAIGHGKIILSNYFLNKADSSKLHLTKIVSIATISHFAMAIILFILFKTILSSLPIFSRYAFQNKISVGSGVLISLIGFYLLFTKFVKINFDLISKYSGKNDIVIAFLAGSIPCPLTITVLLTSYSLDVLIFGLMVALSITAGLFIMLMILCFLTTKIVQTLNKFVEESNNGGKIFLFKTIGVIQSCLFITVGLYLVKLGV